MIALLLSMMLVACEQKQTNTTEKVIDAPLNQRAAMFGGAGGDLLARQPERAQDAGVERALGIVRAEFTREGEAQVGHPVAVRWRRRAPQVDADQLLRRERERGFFQRLARRRRRQALAGIEVTGRLVQANAFRGLLLDQQEAAVALDDGGHGDRRFPGHLHSFLGRRRRALLQAGGTIA